MHIFVCSTRRTYTPFASLVEVQETANALDLT